MIVEATQSKSWSFLYHYMAIFNVDETQKIWNNKLFLDILLRKLSISSKLQHTHSSFEKKKPHCCCDELAAEWKQIYRNRDSTVFSRATAAAEVSGPGFFLWPSQKHIK